MPISDQNSPLLKEKQFQEQKYCELLFSYHGNVPYAILARQIWGLFD